MDGRKQLLCVVRWPVGGIRSYMRYVYGCLSDAWQVTVLAVETQERDALAADVQQFGGELVLCRGERWGDVAALTAAVWRQLRSRRYDVIQSQGFTSASVVTAANWLPAVPHVLTVHGVLEERYLTGWKGRIRRAVANRTIMGADVVYGVGHDILGHLAEQVPGFDPDAPRVTAIPTGIAADMYSSTPQNRGGFRRRAGVDEDTFLFGFLGRFMPQKGMDLLIDAVAELQKTSAGNAAFRVVAVGSGDYERVYRKQVQEHGLQDYIVFMPFQPGMTEVYHDLDAVIMPSRWEALPLVAAEALCAGVPLVASDCIGLREAVAATPALTFPAGDAAALAACMARLLADDGQIRAGFVRFQPQAAQRFDVRETARRAEALFDGMIRNRHRLPQHDR